ncbi:hypothetical protein LSH36_713g01124 [Paralvinella palmiformis]|uniref:Uncharacterized protein n=1 Tax=Paralvinella palmiformis TaxID=53620 RepID=A0AAD9J1T0_9ANNE|nr:hypothetical protein LSH36_713g01124 [Paralvinella palmiformis]
MPNADIKPPSGSRNIPVDWTLQSADIACSVAITTAVTTQPPVHSHAIERYFAERAPPTSSRQAGQPGPLPDAAGLPSGIRKAGPRVRVRRLPGL